MTHPTESRARRSGTNAFSRRSYLRPCVSLRAPVNAQQIFLFALILAAAIYLLRTSLWRSILVFRPTSLRIDAEEPAGHEKLPDTLRGYDTELRQLGFQSIGTHSERPWLGPVTTCFDYARPEDHTFATIFQGWRGTPRVYFLTLLADRPDAEQTSGYVISANYRRPAKELPGYITGWLEDVAPQRLYRAHLRRIEGMTCGGVFTQESRVAVARAFQEGPGRLEARQQHIQGLLWTLGSLGMVAAAIIGTLRSSR